jgi:hypothetical protein
MAARPRHRPFRPALWRAAAGRHLGKHDPAEVGLNVEGHLSVVVPTAIAFVGPIVAITVPPTFRLTRR